jgi:NTE family protein
VGLVLSSPGIRGFAGLPIIDMLARERIKVDLMVGASGGAFLAALWSGGYNLGQIKNLFLSETTRRALTHFDQQGREAFSHASPLDFTLRAGLHQPRVLRNAFDFIFKDLEVQELIPETVITATDLRSGSPVSTESGPVSDAVYAAGALYPLMPPLPLEDLLLADGMYSAPLPVMEAVKRDMDIIIAVSTQDEAEAWPSGFLDCFMHVARNAAGHLQRSQSALSVDMHHYEILHLPVPLSKPVSFWDIEKLEYILKAGTRAAERSREEILRLVEGFRAVQLRERGV